MYNNYTPYGATIDPSVINDIKNINKELKEESKKDNVDKEKIMNLKLKRLYKSMEINNDLYSTNFRSRIPY